MQDVLNRQIDEPDGKIIYFHNYTGFSSSPLDNLTKTNIFFCFLTNLLSQMFIRVQDSLLVGWLKVTLGPEGAGAAFTFHGPNPQGVRYPNSYNNILSLWSTSESPLHLLLNFNLDQNSAISFHWIHLNDSEECGLNKLDFPSRQDEEILRVSSRKSVMEV